MSKTACKCGCAPMHGFNHVSMPKSEPVVPYKALCRFCSKKMTAAEMKAAAHRCSNRAACLERAIGKALPKPKPMFNDAAVKAVYHAATGADPDKTIPADDPAAKQWEYAPSSGKPVKARVMALAKAA